jgi:hypothetical protein
MSATSPSTRLLTRAQLEAAGRALGTGGAGATQLLALLHDPDVEVERVLDSLTPAAAGSAFNLTRFRQHSLAVA